MGKRAQLPNKYASETVTVTFDFTADLASGETISTQAVSAATYSGTDASPSSIVSGSASASGAVVSQKITAGTTGVMYELTCSITTSAGQTLRQVGLMGVIPSEA